MARLWVVLSKNLAVCLLQILQHNNDENLLRQHVDLLRVSSRIKLSEVELVSGVALLPTRFVEVLHQPQDDRVLALQNLESHRVALDCLLVLRREQQELVLEMLLQL